MSVVYEFKKLAKGSTFCISYTVDHIIYIQATLIQYCIIDSSFLAESCCQVCGCENSRCFQTFAINVLNISNHNPNPYSSYKLLYFNYFPSKLAKTVPVVILLCLTPDDFTYQGRASGCERVNWTYLPVCPSLFLNPFSPRPAKTVHFVILLCLTPDNFTRQGSFVKSINLFPPRDSPLTNKIVWH